MRRDKPNWAPLEAVGGPKLCGEFMWRMRRFGIEYFKHIRTRRYLLLDSDGRCYRRTATGFEAADLDTELKHARGGLAWTRWLN
jgi:hypothetical protein